MSELLLVFMFGLILLIALVGIIYVVINRDSFEEKSGFIAFLVIVILQAGYGMIVLLTDL